MKKFGNNYFKRGTDAVEPGKIFYTSKSLVFNDCLHKIFVRTIVFSYIMGENVKP